MSTTARAQSLDRLTDFTIWPLGMVIHLALGGAQLGDPQGDVLDRAIGWFGDVPTVSETRSPKPYCFSVMMKNPDEQVLHDALRAETERGAEHRGGRDQGTDRDGEDRR